MTIRVCRFGFEKSRASWLLNQLSFFPITNISRAACFKDIRNPWGVHDMDSSTLLKLWIFYLETQTGHRVFPYFAAKRRKKARVPPRLASQDGDMMEISRVKQPTILTRVQVPLDMRSTINFYRTLCLSQIWNTPNASKCPIELV